jgi:hypothetical protein
LKLNAPRGADDEAVKVNFAVCGVCGVISVPVQFQLSVRYAGKPVVAIVKVSFRFPVFVITTLVLVTLPWEMLPTVMEDGFTETPTPTMFPVILTRNEVLSKAATVMPIVRQTTKNARINRVLLKFFNLYTFYFFVMFRLACFARCSASDMKGREK